MAYSNARITQANSQSPIHVDCRELLQDHRLDGLSDEQLNQVYDMLQFAWNRGYKEAYEDAAQ